MKKLAIFASGGGSNALKIHEHFLNNQDITIDCIIVNNPKAGIIQKAKDWNCDIINITKEQFNKDDEVSKLLTSRNIDLIVLAGFLWLIPQHLLKAFPNKIVNIHPALLPNYGGKGMYGMNVHTAVFNANEKESGITIHTIDEVYDRGTILFQKSVNIENCTSPAEIATAVLKVEHDNFAKVIEDYLTK